MENPRELRGLRILSQGQGAVQRAKENEYRVRSESGTGSYKVWHDGVNWQCECPDAKKNNATCKHQFAVALSIKLRVEVKNRAVLLGPGAPQDDGQFKPTCPHCQSDVVVKDGNRHCEKGDVQKYLCKACSRNFIVDRGFSRLKASEKTIIAAVDLYFKGVSYGNIAHHLKEMYRLKVNRSTVYRWVSRISQLLADYEKTAEQHPDVSDFWHSDEMTQNVDGKQRWLWNVMDAETRYWLAARLTNGRNVKDARKPLKDAKTRAGKRPKFLITDGLQSYNEAVYKELYTAKDPTVHIRLASIRTHPNNNNLERLNGTERDRTKTMRAFDQNETAQVQIEGQRFYYNHIRPHMSLKGRTPAEVAQMLGPSPIEGETRWLPYIIAAAKARRKNETPDAPEDEMAPEGAVS